MFKFYISEVIPSNTIGYMPCSFNINQANLTKHSILEIEEWRMQKCRKITKPWQQKTYACFI